MKNTTPDRDPARHRALSDASRVALLRLFEAAECPLDAHTLAERVGLHVNTVRWHLDVLVAAGLVIERRGDAHGRGRPRKVYDLVPGALDDQTGGFRLLVEVLLDALDNGGGSTAVEQAGRARGRRLVRLPPGGRAAAARQAVARVVGLLEAYGFQPELRRGRGGRRIAMRPCPFGAMATEHGAIVCSVHLGLIRGALDALGAPVEATSLEPYARPDLCLAHLRPRAESDDAAHAPAGAKSGQEGLVTRSTK